MLSTSELLPSNPFIMWAVGFSATSCFFLGSLLAYACYHAFYYRPLPDYRSKGMKVGITKLRELPAEYVPLGLLVARGIIQFLVVSIFKFIVGVRNTVEVVKDENYSYLMQQMRSRQEGVSLLTASNHASSLDDPGLLSCLIPMDVAMSPKRMRWSLATQEIAFPNIPLVQAFMGAGQVLPIWRGGGIDQPLFFDVCRQIAAGRWIHLFPEARVVQSGILGIDPVTKRSEAELKEKGLLKWGIGKLIAHLPKRPVFVPFYHVGMTAVLPQHNRWEKGTYNNLVISWDPRHYGRGNKVKVWVGESCSFDDLIEEHEKKHGPLWKIPTEAPQEKWEETMKQWKSREVDKPLYHHITRRVEKCLKNLEARSLADLDKHPDPLVQKFCQRCVAAMPKKHSD
uniref:Tafazzin family protein n=1 Tax=Guillardia theta TaxID=55529 RepID=A0A7S4NET4_GUITH|mmetsp:Transcript_21002/g.70039  ORF Transcript_21002/g.70039 Transcript_21002/m.70039 type:complete len:397 (+) Transcript_21002:70-1260(+)